MFQEKYNLDFSQAVFSPDKAIGSGRWPVNQERVGTIRYRVDEDRPSISIGLDPETFSQLDKKSTVAETIQELWKVNPGFIRPCTLEELVTEVEAVQGKKVGIMVRRLFGKSMNLYIEESGTEVELKLHIKDSKDILLQVTDPEPANVLRARQVCAQVLKRSPRSEHAKIKNALAQYETVHKLRRLGYTYADIGLKLSLQSCTARAWITTNALPKVIDDHSAERSEGRRSKELSLPRMPSEEMAYLLGAFAAITTPGIEHTNLHITSRDRAKLLKLVSYIEEAFKTKVTVLERKGPAGISYHISIRKSEIMKFLDEITAKNTRVPWEFLPQEKYGSYFSGIFDWGGIKATKRDGTQFGIKFEKQLSAAKPARNLVLELCEALCDKGIFPRVTTRKDSSAIAIYSKDDMSALAGVLTRLQKGRRATFFSELEQAKRKESYSLEHYDLVKRLLADGLPIKKVEFLSKVPLETIRAWESGESQPYSVRRRNEIRARLLTTFDRDVVREAFQDRYSSDEARQIAKLVTHEQYVLMRQLYSSASGDEALSNLLEFKKFISDMITKNPQIELADVSAPAKEAMRDLLSFVANAEFHNDLHVKLSLARRIEGTATTIGLPEQAIVKFLAARLLEPNKSLLIKAFKAA